MKQKMIILMATLAIGAAILAYYTIGALKPAPESFLAVLSNSHHVQIRDRNGAALHTTYQNDWNIHDIIALHEVPDFFKQVFILSEDKRFYTHSGPDWLARSSALLTNIKARRAARGASTITEQVVRMIHPRPRTIWSRWLEGFEASALERHFSKEDILEFYFNQVPYTANRRGIVQAARYYFNRDLDTLSKKEILVLVILVRAPSRLDLWKDTEKISASIKRLASQLQEQALISEEEKHTLLAEELVLEQVQLIVNAREFVSYVKQHPHAQHAGWPHINTTLDSALQHRIQKMLDHRLASLHAQKVSNGAVLVVDHTTNEILAWVVAGKQTQTTPGRFIDAVTTPRQPGSSLKPFLYALALEKGWSAATLIEDAPLIESVGNGLHAYQNYSRTFYGPVTLRQALGNSLNIPALKTLQYVGAEAYLHHLNKLGFSELTQHPDFYGDGIALGNGEVTLYELVQAYTALANHGTLRPITPFSNGSYNQAPRKILPPEIASLMAHILSDPHARSLEFGTDSILNFPVQTAVKTGTSNDYRDSWAVGFNSRYTVGAWMGNLNQTPTDGITGSTGPALLLRSIFATLTMQDNTKPLPIHKRLIAYDLCIDTKQVKQAEQLCESYTEWFVPGTIPHATKATVAPAPPIRLQRPMQGLHIAYDPRLSAAEQAFEFYIQNVAETDTVIWNIDGIEIRTQGGKYIWPIEKGPHRVEAIIYRGTEAIATVPNTHFLVK